MPGTFAAEDELFALGEALAGVGRGVFELAPAGIQGEDLSAPDREVDWMRRLSARTGRPITYALSQHDVAPDDWRASWSSRRRPTPTAPLRRRSPGRPLGLLLGLQSFHPFLGRPTYLTIADLPLDERVAELRRPEIRDAILAETSRRARLRRDRTPRPHLPVGDPPEYEPAPERDRRPGRTRGATPTRCSTTSSSPTTAASC